MESLGFSESLGLDSTHESQQQTCSSIGREKVVVVSSNGRDVLKKLEIGGAIRNALREEGDRAGEKSVGMGMRMGMRMTAKPKDGSGRGERSDRLDRWLVGWLAGWLVGWLAGWLVGSLARWLVGSSSAPEPVSHVARDQPSVPRAPLPSPPPHRVSARQGGGRALDAPVSLAKTHCLSFLRSPQQDPSEST
jgi:hypothetical protein